MEHNPKLESFLQKAQIATLALPIDINGTIHIAAMRCMTSLEPVKVYFVTSISSEKCTLLKQQTLVRAACDIGGQLGTEMYVQMRGKVRIWALTSKPDIVDSYLKHRGQSDKLKEGSDSVLLEFTPSYLKYTDYTESWEKHIVKL